MKTCLILLVLVFAPLFGSSASEETFSAQTDSAVSGARETGTATADRTAAEPGPRPPLQEQNAVDWSTGIVRVTGVGLPPAHGSHDTISREMAERAALSDGERKLVKAIADIRVGQKDTVRSRLREKDFAVTLQGYIKNYKVVGRREFPDGRIEVDLELPLTGNDGLSRYLFQ